MDSLARAKQFVARKATKLALAIVPLAALVVAPSAAKAGTISVAGSGYSCVVSGSTGNAGGSCSATSVQNAGANSSLNWLRVWGSGSTFGVDQSLFMHASGTASGITSSGSLPVSWDFLLTDTTALGDVSADGTWGGNPTWSLDATIGLASGGSYTYHNGGAAQFGTWVTGNDVMTFGGGIIDTWDFTLTVQTNGSGSYSLNVPSSGSIDLNDVTSPEPAAWLLSGLGGGALLLLRKLRKRA